MTLPTHEKKNYKDKKLMDKLYVIEMKKYKNYDATIKEIEKNRIEVTSVHRRHKGENIYLRYNGEHREIVKQR